MAYREFHYEKTYAKPDYSHYMDESTHAISNMFQQVAKRREDRLKAADQWGFDYANGSFENDTKLISAAAANTIEMGKREMYKDGKISWETQKNKEQTQLWGNLSKLQMQKAADINKKIIENNDPYYDREVDLKKIPIAVNGEDGQRNLLERGHALIGLDQNIGKIDSFKYTTYRADFAKKKGSQYKEETTGDPNATRTKYNEATFWDNKTGKPGVTDEAVSDFLNSDPQGRVQEVITKKVNDQIAGEIDRMKSSGDSRVSWMKGKSTPDIMNELINDPSKNIINNRDFGTRVNETVKNELSDADRINSKVSVNYKADKNTNGGLYKNPNIVHDYSFDNSKSQGSISGGSINPYDNPSVGGTLIQKSGKPIMFTSTNPIRTNINTGRTNKNVIGSQPFYVSRFQLQAFGQNGAPVLLHGNNTDELIDFTKKMPLEWFDPNGKYKLQPELKIALQGYTVNKANILNAANNSVQTIQSKMAEAQNSNNSDEMKALEGKLESLRVLNSMIESGADDQELSLAASRAGISGVQINELVQASDSDLSNIKAITQGFDLKNTDYHSDDMRRLQSAYKERSRQAAASGFKEAPVKQARKSKVKTVSIGPDDFNTKWSSLKSGEQLTGPDGITYTKK